MPEVTRVAFNAGELSDELAGRIDLKKSDTGCEVLENARVLRAGGVARRAGFKYIAGVNDTTKKTRLVGFSFSEEQGYVLELSHLTMRVIEGGVVGATVYTTPWTEDQVFDLQFAQRIDRIIVTHPDVKVHNIVRHYDGTWGVSEYPWTTRIWETHPTTTDPILCPGATTGNTTITSSSPIFLASPSWVGDRIRIDHRVGEAHSRYNVSDQLTIHEPTAHFDQATGVYPVGDVATDDISGWRYWYICTQAYNGATDYVAGKEALSDYPDHWEQGVTVVPPTLVKHGWVFETFGTWQGTLLVQRSYNSGATWTTVKNIYSNNDKNERLTETEDEEAQIRVVVSRYAGSYSKSVDFTVNAHLLSGSAIVTARNSDTEVAVTVEEDFQSTDDSTLWYEAAFSPRNGYPVAATFYQSRLAFGGTATRPQTIWMSRAQKPFDFTFGTLATDGMSFGTDAEGYEAITWLSSHLSLIVGTTLGVWAITSPDGSSLTPESNSIKRQMQLGASSGFQAAPIQNNVLFLQRKGRKIQELTGGSVEYGGYSAADLTQLATHITRGGVTQMVAGSLPDSALFLVTGGELAVLTYERSQNVVGWARWVTNGTIESFATTTGAAEDDDLWIVVKRGGSRYIEHLAPDMLRVEESNDVANLRFLDCYTEKVEATEFTTVAGLERFNGGEVDTFIDGEPAGLVTVTGGVATLPHPAKNAVVGNPYTTEVRPTSFDFGAIGSKTAVIELMIRFRNSLGGETSQTREEGSWSTIQQPHPRSTDGTPRPLVSHDFKSTPHSTRGRRTSISVRQTQPLPMTILAMRITTKSSK